MGFSHILVVTYESAVFSWGAGSRGQLGHGDTEPQASPQLVEALKGRTITRYPIPDPSTILRRSIMSRFHTIGSDVHKEEDLLYRVECPIPVPPGWSV